jgi:uncharacterized coiled-coil DUF342 family protein
MLWSAERVGLRRAVREHIYRKHHEIFAKHLPEILLVGHNYLNLVSGEALKLRVSRDQLHREIELIAADARALRESRDRLQNDIDFLAATVEPERETLRRVQAELADCRREMAFMESTRAWRLRGALVRLKHRLRGTG